MLKDQLFKVNIYKNRQYNKNYRRSIDRDLWTTGIWNVADIIRKIMSEYLYTPARKLGCSMDGTEELYLK